MAALTPDRLTLLQGLAASLVTAIEDTDVVPGALPDPEAPTPDEIKSVSDMLDAANGTLAILGSIATDTTTTAQQKVDLLLQTLGISAP